MTAEAKSVRYPIRLLRYWFAYHLLCIESVRREAPVDLIEIGVQNSSSLSVQRLFSQMLVDGRCWMR